MVSLAVTKRSLTLGAQDTVTGWYAKSFTEDSTDQEMIILDKGSSAWAGGVGLHALYTKTGFTAEPYTVDDEVKDAANVYYRIMKREPIRMGTSLICYRYELAELGLHADFPTTSGTWHLDSSSLKTDARYRTKLWLDTYLTAANMKDDINSATTVITCFAGADYSLNRVFNTKDVDGIFVIDKATVTPRYTSDHYIYAFEESMPITCYAVNKSVFMGKKVTAVNLLEKMEQEIRRITTAYPRGSLRKITAITNEPVNFNGETLYSTTVNLEYVRANDDYTPTYPTFDYGIGYVYEGDRLTGGAEGDWTIIEGSGSTCTQAISSDNNLVLTQTVFSADSYTYNATNLGLSSTTYYKYRCRFKTTGNATAKVTLTFSDASSATVMSETASVGAFTVVLGAIPTGKTIDHINLNICDGTGTVTYDFFEIFTDIYVLPNCTQIEPPVMVNDAVIDVPGRVGSVDQLMGGKSMEVTTEHDLDMEPYLVTWKRPQASTPKTDFNNQDVLLETLHRGSFYENWTWLDLGDPAMQFKARLVEMRPSYTGEAGKLRLVWREYRHGNASGETVTERFGLNL
jgi:hypothetical protein